MVRKGRDLEKLVKILEELGTKGMVVKSPDHIFDKVANKPREVDVSIRGRIDTHDILIIFECRKRKTKGGIDWIEHIVTKTKDLGANRVVAVSPLGFTNGAIEKAKMHNVITRTLKQVSINEIPGWLNFCETKFKFLKSEFKQIIVIYNDENNQKSELPLDVKGKSPIFIQKKDGKHIFFNDIWHSLPIDKLHSKELEKPYKILIGIPKGQEGLAIILGDNIRDVLSIAVIADVWIETKTIAKPTIQQYKEDNDLIAQIHKFEPGYGYTLEAIEKKKMKNE